MVNRIQPYYNLDVIIAVGYRVNSPQATHFRIWATGVLKEVLLRGYAVNERIERLERRVAKTEEQIPFSPPALLPLPLRPWRMPVICPFRLEATFHTYRMTEENTYNGALIHEHHEAHPQHPPSCPGECPAAFEKAPGKHFVDVFPLCRGCGA